MLEFELRFKNERGISLQLAELGFQKKDELSMADLIFEPRDWKPGDMIAPGYYIVRIRLAHGNRPKLEVKEFRRTHEWNETHFSIEGPDHFVRLLSMIMVPRRIIEKKREVWANGSLSVCLDDVRHLGRFVEIEGPELEVKELAIALGFRLDDAQPGYGTQLFYLEKTGLVPFHPDEMKAVLREFGHCG